MTWTRDKERKLQALREELEALGHERAQAVEDVERVAIALGYPQGAQAVEFARLLIANADNLRDALEPFDSGVRPHGPHS